VLTAEVNGAILITDAADGRRVARGLGLQVTGVLGVLIEAKARGLVSAVTPILDALVDAGFWLGEPLRKTILDAAREQ
jgi:predicted nucleic acid-binding protein